MVDLSIAMLVHQRVPHFQTDPNRSQCEMGIVNPTMIATGGTVCSNSENAFSFVNHSTPKKIDTCLQDGIDVIFFL